MEKRYHVRVKNPVDGETDILRYEDKHVACMVFANYIALDYAVCLYDDKEERVIARTLK